MRPPTVNIYTCLGLALQAARNTTAIKRYFIRVINTNMNTSVTKVETREQTQSAVSRQNKEDKTKGTSNAIQ